MDENDSMHCSLPPSPPSRLPYSPLEEHAKVERVLPVRKGSVVLLLECGVCLSLQVVMEEEAPFKLPADEGSSDFSVLSDPLVVLHPLTGSE